MLQNNLNYPWKLISVNQAQKEYSINYNFVLLDFLLYPKIKEFVKILPLEAENGEAFILNSNDDHHNKIVLFYNGFHYIKPKNNMKIFYNNYSYYFNNQQWILIGESND